MNITISFDEFSFLIAAGIFFAYMLIDAMYAYYTLEITKRKPVSSATIGAIMHFLIALGILGYVNNFLYIIPIIIGSWLGTYGMVKYEQKRG